MSVELAPGGWIPEGSERAISDESRVYHVAISESRLEELRSLLRRVANSFDQNEIYLSIRGYVEYLVPSPTDGFLE